MATVLARRYQAHLAILRDRAAVGVQSVWDRLPGYDEKNVEPFLAKAVPIIGDAQRGAVRLTDAYMARAAKGKIYGLLAGPNGQDLIGAGVRNGVSPEDVYRRPLVTVWTALSKGVQYDKAIASGLARATATAQTDVALSTRAAAVEYGNRDPNIIGWSRVPDDGCCDLCELASEQRYGSSDLMPIHDRCGCTVEPETGSLGDTAPPSGELDGVAVAIQEHGELGPVLTKAGDNFTSEADLEE